MDNGISENRRLLLNAIVYARNSIKTSPQSKKQEFSFYEYFPKSSIDAKKYVIDIIFEIFILIYFLLKLFAIGLV